MKFNVEIDGQMYAVEVEEFKPVRWSPLWMGSGLRYGRKKHSRTKY